MERETLSFLQILSLSDIFFESSNLQRFLQILQFLPEFSLDLHRSAQFFKYFVYIMMEEAVAVEEAAGPLLFPEEWGARYPAEGQTAADAPPGFITLYADFFGEGNFRLPVTHLMEAILHHYGFHIS
ncbi:hypothetical protein Hanom_Chr15g01406161 [Helianthus anomalus]